MRYLYLILLATTAFCVQIVQVDGFSLRNGIDPISVKSDGTGRYYFLDSKSRLLAYEGDSLVMEIDPTAGDIDWVEPVDIGYSSGWLYIADKTDGALYLTDKYLRSPAKIDLKIGGVSVRPADFAVSTDGRILIWDDDDAELLLYDDWRDQTPTRLSLPGGLPTESIEISFDFASSTFIVITGRKLLEYSILGSLRSKLGYPSPEPDVYPMAASSILGSRLLVDNRGIWSFTDDTWSFHLAFRASVADISIRGRILIIEDDSLKIFEVDASQ